MKNRLTSFISRYFPVLVIFCLWSLVVYTNHTPGTWLTGWDNLHSEFNLILNIKRSLSAAWQEYQGLGLLGGMAHAADLPRQLILLLFSLFVPNHLLRYLWLFLMLLIGPIGAYFLLARSIKVGKLGSLVGASFYLLNLATVQYFYAPFETFVSFYGFFPWLIYLALSYLKDGGKRKLAGFFILSLLATSAFYVQTLFVVYILVLLIFILEYLIRNQRRVFGRVFKLVLALISANTFWLLPIAYFTFTNSGVISASKINHISTSEGQFMNWGTGNLKDVALLKGFWFHYTDYFNKFDYLMRDWRVYFEESKTEVFGYTLFLVSVLGIVISLLRKKENWRFSWFVVFIFGLFMLFGVSPPFGFIYKLLISYIPLFGQIFRSSFTKVSVALALFYAVGIGFLVKFISSFTKDKRRYLSFVLSFILIFFSILTVLPVFEGKLISANVRQTIPDSYLQTFEFFKGQPKQARIARFPVHTFWGWDFYDWGYRGSGFLWYGIEQPILDRAFDVWSKFDEGYYHEISTAVYGDDWEGVMRVLDKYDVSYALLDESVIAPDRDSDHLKLGEIKKNLEEAGAKLVFSKKDIFVYDVRGVGGTDSFVHAPEKYISANANLDYSRKDPVFENYGDYYTKDANNSKYYPFTHLLKEKTGNVSYRESDFATSIEFNSRIDSSEDTLVVPELTRRQKIGVPTEVVLNGRNLKVNLLAPVEVTVGDKLLEFEQLPAINIETEKSYQSLLISIGNNIAEVSQGERRRYVSRLTIGEPVTLHVFNKGGGRVIDLNKRFQEGEISKCWEREGVEGVVETSRIGDILSIRTKDAAGCLSFNLGRFGKEKSLLRVALPFKSEGESRPYFCILREGEQVNCENEEVYYATSPSESWKSVIRDIITSGGVNYWLSIAGKPSNEPGKQISINYQVPEVINYPIVESVVVGKEVWDKFLQDTKFKLSSNGNLSVSFVAVGEDIDIGGVERVSNCDTYERGWIEKSEDRDFALFKTGGRGALCDWAYVVDANTKENYLVRFIGNGLSGNGLKFYITNKASIRSDLEETLPNGKFDVSYLLLAWPGLSDSGYSLNFQNKSFGGELAENKLARVKFYSVPVEWLARWYVEEDENSQPIKSDLDIRGVDKFGTYTYRVDVAGKGLLTLSQGYEDGWQAFSMANAKCQMLNVRCRLPWLFGERLEHVKVNSWANGWIIENQSAINNQQSSILIIYWPQYLQYFGFILIPLAVIFILISGKKRKGR